MVDFGKELKTVKFGKLLEKQFGGKWTFSRSTHQWACDDKNRYVCYVVTHGDGQTQPCLYYRDGSKPAEWV